MRNHDLSHDCLRTAAAAAAAVAVLIAGGIGVAAAQKAPAEANPSAPSAPSAPAAPAAQVPQSGPAFVNGALAAPGADQDAATVPAKFSAKHDAEDHLPTLAFTFKNLSDAQRRAIVASVKDARTAVIAQMPEMKGYRYNTIGDKVLLVEPENYTVVAVLGE